MSNRYKGGIISATPPTTTGGESGVASGAWTLEQQMQAQAAGLWPSPPPPLYIEDVFSTYLYTGNGTSQSIVNGIDLSTKGGLVWTKSRSDAFWNEQTDTARGPSYYLSSNSTIAQVTSQPNHVTAFNTNGFSVGNESDVNNSGSTFASWTFRKQPKFFDVVTWTGNGVSGRAIPHNLQSAPGFIAIKLLSSADNWECYHRGVTFDASNVLWLNSTNAITSGGSRFTSQPTSTNFYVGSDSGVNGDGRTYVAYLFAHDAGGFGLSGTDNVISCGSFSVDGSGDATVDLGYEPQWVMIKTYEAAANWAVFDNMRGMPVGNTNVARLFPNTSGAESSSTDYNVSPTATGFTAKATGYAGSSTDGFIYIAIRRGPMKVPTSGTSVYQAATGGSSGSATTPNFTSGFPVDFAFWRRPDTSSDWPTGSRLAGAQTMSLNLTDAESANSNYKFDYQTGWYGGSLSSLFYSWMFRRAPSVLDVVCYTGTGASRNVSHNLQVVPEMMIVKDRTSVRDWVVYSPTIGTSFTLYLNGDNPKDSFTGWGGTPTSTTFALTSTDVVNASGNNYVAYLFATCAGVSKVGSYTGTGAAQTINCGFTAGSRFVMIKRTDSTGDWYVWDSARGIIPANDPYLLLNSTDAEVTGTDYVDTTSVGFDITSTAPAAINASGGTFIFLAIA